MVYILTLRVIGPSILEGFGSVLRRVLLDLQTTSFLDPMILREVKNPTNPFLFFLLGVCVCVLVWEVYSVDPNYAMSCGHLRGDFQKCRLHRLPSERWSGHLKNGWWLNQPI